MPNIGSAPIGKNFEKGLIAQSSTGVRTDPLVELYADPTTHRLLVDAGTITTSSASVGTTGSAVPASADYIGFNSGGNLVGVSLGQQTAANSIPVILPSATITTLTPPSNTGYALDSSLSTIDTDLKSNITLHAGTNIIGKVTTDQTTHGTTDLVAADITKIGGSALTIGQQSAANSIPVILPSATITTLTPPAAITGFALDTSVNGLLVAQASTTSGQSGPLVQGAVTTNAPSYTTAKTSPLSLDPAGLLRVTLKDTPANTTNLNFNLAASAATVTVTAANLQTNLNQIAGNGISTAASGIQLVGLADGAGNKITTNSTTYTAKFGVDVNILGTLGTAFSTAGKVDVKAADGDVFVRSNAASTFPTQATLQTQTDTVMVGGVNIKEINAVTPLMGNGATGTGSQRVTVANDNTGIANWGQGATGSAVPSGSQYVGGLAKTALPAAASDGNLTGVTTDKFGRQVVVPAIRDLVASQATTLSNTTSETTIVTAGAAGVFNDIVSIKLNNTSASAVRVDIRDATAGTIIDTFYLPAGDLRGAVYSVPWTQTSSANNWTAQCSATVTDVRISVQYLKNK